MRFGGGILAIANSILLAVVVTAATTAEASVRVVKLDLTTQPLSIRRALRPWVPGISGGKFEQELDYDSNERAYFAKLAIGNPPQSVSFLVDTGSTTTWVLNRDATCGAQGGCNSTYNPDVSSTSAVVQKGGFNVSYVSSDTAKGDWIRETLGLGGDNGVVVKDLQIGLAKESNLSTGILGLGYPSSAQPGDPPPLIGKLKSDGYISAMAYSLYLDDVSATTGSILFGGIDKTRFSGPLRTVDEVPNKDNMIEHFRVNLAAISADQSSLGGGVLPLTSGTSSLRVLLDSGTTITRLPNNIVTHIYNQFKVRDDRNNSISKAGLIDCTMADQLKGTTIDFIFGRSGDTNPVAIKVPFREFVIDNIDNATLADLPQDLGFSRVCLFGLLDNNSSAGISIIGQNVLRSAYVVFDIEHKKVGLAQAKVGSSGSSSGGDSEIIEITEKDGIPDGLVGKSSQGGTPTVSDGTGGNPSGPANPTSTGQNGGMRLQQDGLVGPVRLVILVSAFIWSF